jgi:hypothetical protein
MPKFILIDHSIVGNGGHYLEYATHVIDAAQKLGYEACLATNRNFKGQVNCKCFRIYQYDFWGKSSKKSLRDFFRLSGYKGRIFNFFSLLMSELAFSQLGYCYLAIKRRIMSIISCRVFI